jgi:hypothetical protein
MRPNRSDLDGLKISQSGIFSDEQFGVSIHSASLTFSSQLKVPQLAMRE